MSAPRGLRALGTALGIRILAVALGLGIGIARPVRAQDATEADHARVAEREPFPDREVRRVVVAVDDLEVHRGGLRVEGGGLREGARNQESGVRSQGHGCVRFLCC